jgi:integrase/recombinase XerD
MKCIFNCHGIVSDSLEGPLAAHLSSFSTWVRSLGYTIRSAGEITRIGASFSQWLGENNVQLREISLDHVESFLRHRGRTRNGERAALKRLIEFLRQQHLIAPAQRSASPSSAADRCARGYELYLREDRALANATITGYLPYILDFLRDRFGDGRVKLTALRARAVVRFVQSRAQHLHVTRVKIMAAALRSFFQYTRLRGEVSFDLAAVVPTVANWSMPSIPRAIAPDKVRRLLASIDRTTPIGRRDYAILLILARLGLRAGEVVSLELEDIDWRAAKLTVRSKCDERREMPLRADVGKAIAAYLRRGRPRCSSRRVFLRTKAPIGGFRGTSGVGSIVRSRIQQTGIEAPTTGAHQFRHGLAKEMLRHGGSLAEIGAVLGHRRADTTRIYSKVDLSALHALAQPWPAAGL